MDFTLMCVAMGVVFTHWNACKQIARRMEAPSHRSCLPPPPKGLSRAAKRGVFQTGGFPDLDLSFLFCPFLSFLGLSRFFWDFPDLLGDGPGIFSICPFPLSRPIKSAYEEQSRKGPRHNLDLSRKKWETPGFGNTRV